MNLFLTVFRKAKMEDPILVLKWNPDWIEIHGEDGKDIKIAVCVCKNIF